jgi:hypothetical protein
MDMSDSAAQAAANAQADLARAEAQAQALLNELEASDPAPRKKYNLPSPYAPGEGPPDPVKGVAQPDSFSDVLGVGGGNWKPSFNESTLPKTDIPPNSGHIDFAQKVKDARKPHGSH